MFRIPQLTANKYGIACMMLYCLPLIAPMWRISYIIALTVSCVIAGVLFLARRMPHNRIVAPLIGGAYYRVEIYAVILFIENAINILMNYTPPHQ